MGNHNDFGWWLGKAKDRAAIVFENGIEATLTYVSKYRRYVKCEIGNYHPQLPVDEIVMLDGEPVRPWILPTDDVEPPMQHPPTRRIDSCHELGHLTASVLPPSSLPASSPAPSSPPALARAQARAPMVLDQQGRVIPPPPALATRSPQPRLDSSRR